MRTTKKLTVSAMATALGAALMALGAAVEVIDMALAALASLLIIIIIIEVGQPYPWLVWLSTSLITFLLSIFMESTVWLMYFVFGVFPIIKLYVEKLRRGFWLLLKLVYVNLCIIGLAFALELIFGLPRFETDPLILKVGIYILSNVAFLMYDRLLTLASRIYFEKLRPRFRTFFK